MRSLDAVQEARVRARALAPVKIVKLTQYSDRLAGTVGATWYFSDRVVRYAWGGGAVIQAEALLRGCDPITSSMADVPSPEGRYAGALIASTRLVLANAPVRGGDYLDELLSAYPLEGADLEIIELAVLPSSDRSVHFDLTAFSGTEHTVWFRGRIVRCEGVDDVSVQLRAESTLPVLRWLYATDPATVDPKDLGARLPLVAGSARSVRGVGYVVGWSTTLAAPLASSVGAGGLVVLTDVTGLPSSGTLRVDVEEITYSSLDAVGGTATIAARGQNGTTTASHATGAFVGEVVSEAVWVLNSRPSSSVSAVYLRNPYNGEKLRVPSALSGVNLADTALIAGETVTTLRLTSSDLQPILQEAYASARVSQQPEFADTGDRLTADASPNSATGPSYPSAGLPTVGSFYTSFSGGGSSPRFTCPNTTPAYQTNLTYALVFSGVLPDINAIDVELFATVQYETRGSAAGTYQLYLHPRGFPGFGSGYFPGMICPKNSTGSFPYASGRVGVTAFNPSNWNGHFFYLRPYVAGACSKNQTQTNYVGLSGITIRFGYIDTGGIYRTVDVAIEAASQGFGLDWYADVEGELVPQPPLAAGIAFDSATGFNVSGCAATADTGTKDEGAAALKLVCTETVIEDFESASGWTTSGGVSLSTSGTKTEGSASVAMGGGGSQGDTSFRGLWKTSYGPVDLTGKLLALDVQVPSAASFSYLQARGFTATTGLLIGVASDTGFVNQQQWMFGTNHVPTYGEWFTLLFDPATFPPAFVSGSPDFTAAVAFIFGFAPTAISTGVDFLFDRFRALPKTMIAQKNDLANLNLVATPDAYRLALRTESGKTRSLASAKVYLSNAAGSGTTAPSDRKELAILQSDVGDGAFSRLSVAPTSVGSPGTLTNVETVGISVTLPTSPPAALVGLPTLWVDDLRLRNDSSNPYAGAVGSLIERRPDVLRYLIEDLCGEADGCDDTNFSAADTNLGDGVFGIDVRELGETFQAVAVRLAYEARANLIRVETASGSRFRLLTTGTAYTYGASVRTLTDFQAGGGVAFAGQDLEELRARFFAHYRFDAALQDASSGGYLAMVGATPEASTPAKPTASALEDSEALYGARPADYLFLRAISDADTATDVLGYYASVRSQARRIVIVTGVHWRQGYDLELGDVVAVQPRWRTAPITGRIIEYVKDFRTQVVNLRLAQLPT